MTSQKFPTNYSGTITVSKAGVPQCSRTSSWWTYSSMRMDAQRMAAGLYVGLNTYTWSYSPDSDAINKKAFTGKNLDRNRRDNAERQRKYRAKKKELSLSLSLPL